MLKNYTTGFSFTQLLYLHTGSTESTRIPPVLQQFQLCGKHTISGTCNHLRSQTGFRESSSDLSKPALGITNVASEEKWASLGFLTTSVWNLPTLKSFWEQNKPNSSMWMRLTLRLTGARWTQADGEQKAPFTGLFAVSGKWNSFFFFFKLWSICSYLSKQDKNREQRKRNKDSWLKGKNISLQSTDPKENF